MLAKAKAAASTVASVAADHVSEIGEKVKDAAGKSEACQKMNTARARALAISPEDRKAFADVAASVLSLASACGSKNAGR